MYVKICTLILLPLAAFYSYADIYRCQGSDGKWLFTDRQCNNGSSEQIKLTNLVKQTPTLTSSKKAPVGLSKAELRALANLDRRLARERDSRSRERRITSRQISRDNKIRQQNCTLAERQLAEVRILRSQGYRLSEAHKLDQLDRKLQAQKKVNCR